MIRFDRRCLSSNEMDAVRLQLASPKTIEDWSHGEVTSSDTLNYRNGKAAAGGLFCPKIFGPEQDWECACGKYKGPRYKGMKCSRCGVTVDSSRVRRHHMGHIELAKPVAHLWFFKTQPSRLATLLNLKAKDVERIVYFDVHAVIDPGKTGLAVGQVFDNEEYKKALGKFGIDSFTVDSGAPALASLLANINLEQLAGSLRRELDKLMRKRRPSQGQREKLVKRLKVAEDLLRGESDPRNAILTRIPVIPPELRPVVMLQSGGYAISDINELYRRVINRNIRLKKLLDVSAPAVIIRNEHRMLQQAVDALFDNARTKRPTLGGGNRPLKSLADSVAGRQGRFRENLLGKRVDYSARSVIVSGPRLLLHQCGLPLKIALELYQPFVIRELCKDEKIAGSIREARNLIRSGDEAVFDALARVMKGHPVLLNRAPTLHRMNIQAFEPVLVEGNAIRLHPLVCKAFNADFDGDQMAVHLPLSQEAQVEAKMLLMSTQNIFSPAGGGPVAVPSQDIVLGSYFHTADAVPGKIGSGAAVSTAADVERLIDQKLLHIHSEVEFRLPAGKRIVRQAGKPAVAAEKSRLTTTAGRVLFNDILPGEMPFYDLPLSAQALSRVIADCGRVLSDAETIEFLDRLKAFGFAAATASGVSIGMEDLQTPKCKAKVIAKSEKDVAKLRKQCDQGRISEPDRHNRTLDIWRGARQEIEKEMMAEMPVMNPVHLMARSGARGGTEQLQQLAGMRGLMAKPNGEILESPIRSNFREGLRVHEFFQSTHGARKGLADMALKTAQAGYLTRKLADAAQEVMISMNDCGTLRGIEKQTLRQGGRIVKSLGRQVVGRISRRDLEVAGETIVAENELITPDMADRIDALGVQKLAVRSPLACEAPRGICQKCYGADLSRGELAEEGLAVGILAAQSIGEPGTQLTMRTFHSGGADRRAAQQGQCLAESAGTVRLHDLHATEEGVVLGRRGRIEILSTEGVMLESHHVPEGAKLRVGEGEEIAAQTVLCQWDPHITPLLCRASGRVKYVDLIPGESLIVQREKKKVVHRMVKASPGHKPQIVVKSKGENAVYHLPEDAELLVAPGAWVKPGTLLATRSRGPVGSHDITTGLPRLIDLFEAREPDGENGSPKAVLAELSGIVRVGSMDEGIRGKRPVFVQPVDAHDQPAGEERRHLVPAASSLTVGSGDFVEAADPLCDGICSPHDLLAIAGKQAVHAFLLEEIQQVFRDQGVDFDDKHVEIVLSQMLGKVTVETCGDTRLLPGACVPVVQLNAENARLAGKVRVKSPGDSDLQQGQLVSRTEFALVRREMSQAGKRLPKCGKPRKAVGRPLLLGISKVALSSWSFLSAASFQETAKTLADAAWAGRVDKLIGLKENVIAGRLIPAGTGFYKENECHEKKADLALLFEKFDKQHKNDDSLAAAGKI